MHLGYNSYNIVNGLDPALLSSLIPDKTIPIMDAPFTTVLGVSDEVLYEPIDIAFYGTEEFSKVGQYYLKHKIYTTLHPIYDK